MGNFEAFAEDYMEYRMSSFSKAQKRKGFVAIVSTAAGAALGTYGLIKLSLLAASLAIPGLNAISAATGVAFTPTMIAYGLRTIANDDSWSKMDLETRKNIIAGIVVIQSIITLDISSLLDN